MDQNQQTEEQQKLWRRRKSFYKSCGIAVVVALVVAFSIPKEYAVTVTLSPESGESSGSNLGGIASMMGVNLFPGHPFVQPFCLGAVWDAGDGGGR